MRFISDNCGPVHPKIIDAISHANDGYAESYGSDDATQRAETRMREVFEAADASVIFVGTGSAANSLILSTLCQPWHVVYCGELSHIRDDECNAVEFFGGGLKLCPLATQNGKITPETLEAAIQAQGAGDVHRPQPGALSITQLSECGTFYSLDEIRALTAIAHRHGLATHMDGARFANALVAIGCTPAEMSWKLGIDAVSFGGTKNGLMGAEACIIFDPIHDWELALRRKRAAQLFSKHRFLSAQMDAVLRDDLWLDLARRSNIAGQRLATGLGTIDDVRFEYQTDANMLFVTFPEHVRQRLSDASLIKPAGNNNLAIRLVCDWSVTDADVDSFLATAMGRS